MFTCMCAFLCMCVYAYVCALCAFLCTWCMCVHLFACMYTACIPVFMGCWMQRSYQSLKRNSNQFSSKCHHSWAPRHLLAVSLTVAPLKNPYWQQRALCQGWQSCVCLPLLKIKIDTPCQEIKFHLSRANLNKSTIYFCQVSFLIWTEEISPCVQRLLGKQQLMKPLLK